MAYNGTIDLISGIRPKNNGKFPLVHAKDVYVDDNTRLDNTLSVLNSSVSNVSEAINGNISNKINSLLEQTTNLGTRIDNLDANSVNAVSTDANQGLTSQQKQNARDNIGAREIKSETVTIHVSDWQNAEAPYVATVDCSIATANNILFVGVGNGITDAIRKEMAKAQLVCTAQTSGHITITAFGSKPTMGFFINVVGVTT